VIRIMRFVPALAFLVFWLIVVGRGLDMKKAAQAPITSDRFITTIARNIDNPWTHTSALRVFYIQLRQAGAPARIWADSQPFAWALWHQYQYTGGIEIMLLVAHASGNRLEERYWARKYMAVAPNAPRVRRLLQQLRSSRSDTIPMEALGRW
jgi:hypothetical protein